MDCRKPHGNLRFPALHNRVLLEALVNQYRNAEQIALVLHCNPRTVAFAMKKLGIKPLHYCVRKKHSTE